jgi:hypothetical protein
VEHDRNGDEQNDDRLEGGFPEIAGRGAAQEEARQSEQLVGPRHGDQETERRHFAP